jgi:hypothetical protein
MPRATPPDDIDRDLIDLQTQRNLQGLTLESEGRVDEAVVLYEQNIADGFEGDWPYGRLVAYYEKMQSLEDAQRVLERGIEVFTAARRRPAADRRAVLRAFKGRLRLVNRKLAGGGA